MPGGGRAAWCIRGLRAVWRMWADRMGTRPGCLLGIKGVVGRGVGVDVAGPVGFVWLVCASVGFGDVGRSGAVGDEAGVPVGYEGCGWSWGGCGWALVSPRP